MQLEFLWQTNRNTRADCKDYGLGLTLRLFYWRKSLLSVFATGSAIEQNRHDPRRLLGCGGFDKILSVRAADGPQLLCSQLML